MNPSLLRMVDGTGFFLGLASVFISSLLLLRYRSPVGRSILTVLLLVGLGLVVISATPLPLWAYSIWTLLVIAGLFCQAVSRRVQVVICAALAVVTMGLCLAEFPYHRSPKIVVRPETTVYVLGDSLSAGIDNRSRPWPVVLADMIPNQVVNLAQAGATVESAIAQLDGIAEPHSLVIVEIGGNDLLGTADGPSFRRNLESLVSSLCADHHQVLLFELPLVPFQNAFGVAQRQVASHSDVALLPKRYISEVLGMENGTIDGLHLSQAGHDRMAGIVAAVLEPKVTRMAGGGGKELVR